MAVEQVHCLRQGAHPELSEVLISKGRAILGDDMGLGKTRQAIAGMQIAAPTGMILVVCPASLKLNWRREIRMLEPTAKIEVIGVADGAQADPRWVAAVKIEDVQPAIISGARGAVLNEVAA